VPDLSHALAGSYDDRAGSLHLPCTEEITRRSCSGFPGDLVLPVAVLLHPARRIATAAKTAKRTSRQALIFLHQESEGSQGRENPQSRMIRFDD